LVTISDGKGIMWNVPQQYVGDFDITVDGKRLHPQTLSFVDVGTNDPVVLFYLKSHEERKQMLQAQEFSLNTYAGCGHFVTINFQPCQVEIHSGLVKVKQQKDHP
jgi:hypothetical protein